MSSIVSKRWVDGLTIPLYARRPLRERQLAAVPPPSRADRRAVAEAWGNWIAGLTDWNLFGGLTYDQRRRRTDARSGDAIAPGADVARAHVFRWLKQAPQTLGRPINAAVVALEYQRNGWPHFHPLLCVNGGLQGNELEQLGGAWFRAHGYARLERPRDQVDVCTYAAKYLAKDLDSGDLIMWRLHDLARAAASPLLR
jgi:hypothetical protein